MEGKEQKPQGEEKPKEEPKVQTGDDDEDEGDDDGYDPQEEVWREVENHIHLPEVQVKTGEEDDEVVSTFRVKVYRWRGEWKERGTGTGKFLLNKEDKRIRFLVRADKTHKVVINHVVKRMGPVGKIEQLKTSNNAWMWSALDFSDGAPRFEKFAARLPKEEFDRFFREYQKAVNVNNNVPQGLSAEEREEYLKKEEQILTKQQTEKKEQKKEA